MKLKRLLLTVLLGSLTAGVFAVGRCAVLEHNRDPAVIARRMVDNGGLIGLTERDVSSIFGPPVSTNKFPEWHAAFIVGKLGLGVDDLWLLLRYGPDGKVTEASVKAD
jgi:hypothetical protein